MQIGDTVRLLDSKFNMRVTDIDPIDGRVHVVWKIDGRIDCHGWFPAHRLIRVVSEGLE